MNGMSSQFVWTNRSKESLAIAIKSPQGKEVLDGVDADGGLRLQTERGLGSFATFDLSSFDRQYHVGK